MKKLSILIAEDDGWLAEQYERVLKKYGYKVVVVPDAQAAIDTADDFKPDVMILDVLLTGSTAFALLHEMQSFEDLAAIPIILCTNLAGDIKEDDLKPYGVCRVLDKTKMLPSDLIAAITSIDYEK